MSKERGMPSGTRLVLVDDVREHTARAYYRWMMGDDYADFPWDDLNVPSSETQREAEQFAAEVVDALSRKDLSDEVS
jgi:hypothetical protein